MLFQPSRFEFDRQGLKPLGLDRIGVGPASGMQHGAGTAHLCLSTIIALAVPARRVEADIGPFVPVLGDLLRPRMNDAKYPGTRQPVQLDFQSLERRPGGHLRFVQSCRSPNR